MAGRATIGVAGAHSTGKTTLLDDVARRLRRVGYSVQRVPSLAKHAKHLGLPILRDHTFTSTLWIMARGISLELEATMKANVVLIDRPVIDALGYLLTALKFRREKIGKAQFSYLRQLTACHSSTYDALFVTTIDPRQPLGKNKPRDLDVVFRKVVAKQINRVFTTLDVPVTHLPVSESDSRQIVLSRILSLLRA